MGLHLSLRVVLFLIIYAQNIAVFAAGNVTIDDNDSSITYSPPTGAWSRYPGNTLDFLSAHMLTQNRNATASFNFTGTAIYFLSPLWPYQVTTVVSLDSGPGTTIDLQDHSSTSGGSAQTVQSQPVWGATGLANTQHNLLISVGPGGFGVVDALTYTTTENITSPSSSSSSSSSSLSPTSTSQDPIVTSPTAETSSPDSESKSGIVIALGSTLGIFGLFVIGGGVWYFFRRRNRPMSEAWTIDDAPHATSMSRNTSTSAFGPIVTNDMGDRSAEPLYNNRSSTSQPGLSWHNLAPSTDRMSDHYEPGHTLSTTTERSTPQMAEGLPLLATLPPHELEPEYSTAAQGAEAGDGVSRIQRQPLSSSLVGASSSSQDYPSQQRNPSRRKPVGNRI